jgi:hypothetical protein
MDARRSLVILVAATQLALVLSGCCDPRTKLTAGVTGQGVRSLALGMTPEQVLQKIGLPYGRIERSVGTAEWWYSPPDLGFCGSRLTLRVEFQGRKLVGIRAGHEDRDRETDLYVLTAGRSWEEKSFLLVFPSETRAQQ